MKNFRWLSVLFAMVAVALAATVPTAGVAANPPTNQVTSAAVTRKLQRGLLSLSGTIPVAMSVTADPAGDQAIRVIRHSALDPVTTSVAIRGHIIVHCSVDASALADIAQLPAVEWVEKVAARRLLDERQDLILAGHIAAAAPHSPFLGTGYLDFLTNNVGGGLPSFMDPGTYPIIDVTDSGVGTAYGQGAGPTRPCQTAFYKFGDPAGETRLVYNQAVGQFDTTFFGCGVASNGFLYWDNSSNTDINGHGTAVASIISGYSLHSPDVGGFQMGLGVSPFGTIGSTKIYGGGLVFYEFLGYDYTTNNTTGFFYPLSCITYRVVEFPSRIIYPLDISSLLFMAYSSRARIVNNSWGEETNSVVGASNYGFGFYNLDCFAYDVGVRDASRLGLPTTPGPSPLNQEMIVVFANGDHGSSGNVGGFEDVTVLPPATAKNIISVGSSDNVRLDGSGCMVDADQSDSYHLSKSSSFGPTIDGRFKPEIVAPGSSIYTVDAVYPNIITNTYTYGGGPVTGSNSLLDRVINSGFSCTPEDNYVCQPGIQSNNVSSFAAPAVSGAIQLLWWYFQNRLNMLQPSPAMAKAYLCNSARYLPITDPLTGALDTLPSIGQGMGMLDLSRMFDGIPRVLRDESTPRAIDLSLMTTNPAVQQTFFNKSRQAYKVSGRVYDSTKPFRVTVAWTDAPGFPDTTGPQLVNNLDLQVSVNGKSYKGNVFSGDHSIADIHAGFDNVNNMESVFLPAGQTGTWTVVVSATNLGGEGVPNVSSSTNFAGGVDVDTNQDFALVVYNADPALATDASNLTTNDACQSAIEIATFPMTFSNRLNRAIYHNTHPSPSAGPGGIKEFFKISLPTAGTVLSADTFGSDFDTLLSVWQVQILPQTVFVRGDCGALEELISNDNAANVYQSQCGTVYNQPQTLQSAVTWTADGSHSYYIIVEPYNDNLLTNHNHLVLSACATLPPIRLVPATPHDFGCLLIGSISDGFSISLTNGTDNPLVVSSVDIEGANPTDFIITHNECGGYLPSQANCPILLAFQPTTNGTRTAQLVVNYEGTGSPQRLDLTGCGLAPTPVDCFSVNSGSVIRFGTVGLAQTSAWQSVTITNCGTADLIVSNVAITGANSNEFRVVGGTCTNAIAQNAACTINLAFTPAGVDVRGATLVVSDNTTNSPHYWSLSGTGITPTPLVCVSPSLDFGNVNVDTTNVQSLIVSNCGTAPLTISGVTITGANAGEFSITTNSNVSGSIPMGGTGTIGVRFAPPTLGAATAVLQIQDSAADSPQPVTLTGYGSGSQPDLTISRTRTWNLKKLLGYGVYPPPTNTLSQETLAVTGARGRKFVFYLPIWNAGNYSDTFLLRGTGDVAGTYTVKYWLGAIPSESLDVTAAVKAGTFSTSALGAGAFTGLATMLRVEITVDKHAPKSVSLIKINAIPSANVLKTDTVQVKLTVK